jgi:hypothetical protein
MDERAGDGPFCFSGDDVSKATAICKRLDSSTL